MAFRTCRSSSSMFADPSRGSPPHTHHKAVFIAAIKSSTVITGGRQPFPLQTTAKLPSLLQPRQMRKRLRQRLRQRPQLITPQTNHALIHGIPSQRHRLQPPRRSIIPNHTNLYRPLHHPLQRQAVARRKQPKVLHNPRKRLQRLRAFTA